MSTPPKETSITDRVNEPPSLNPENLRGISARALGIRFLAGAMTSVGAGILTIAFNPRVGGIFLAFPAILAASLTLIASEDDKHEAREDARGAVLGGFAMAAFAATGALAFGHWNPAVVLACAAAAWVVVAMVGYLLVWFRLPSRETDR